MIKEVIVVEGRDDTTAVTRALECDTIETHGFGIRKETYQLIERAYNSRGIIIFTDPDHSGEEIRKKLSERFPNAKHAHLHREDARKGTDIGIENADDKAIIYALKLAKAEDQTGIKVFSQRDMQVYGLTGDVNSAERRRQLGQILGIGYGNCNGFLKKLNQYQISRQEFLTAVEKIQL
ncbi:MAG: ribonuclease M5 [Anaerovoracaceae bacterium]